MKKNGTGDFIGTSRSTTVASLVGVISVSQLKDLLSILFFVASEVETLFIFGIYCFTGENSLMG